MFILLDAIAALRADTGGKAPTADAKSGAPSLASDHDQGAEIGNLFEPPSLLPGKRNF